MTKTKPKSQPKTNTERQRAWYARQTTKRQELHEAMQRIEYLVVAENLPGGGGRLNVTWKVQESDRPFLEDLARKAGKDLDAMLREGAIKAVLRGLPPGKVIRENG